MAFPQSVWWATKDGEIAMQPRDITVVIPHYGDSTPTREVVEALASQSSPPHAIVVVDDCSPEPLAAIDGAVVVRSEVNRGFGVTVNRGVEHVTTPYLLILNSDVSPDSDFLSRLCAAATPWMPAVVGPRLVTGAGELEWSARAFPTTRHLALQWLAPLGRYAGSRRWRSAAGSDPRVFAGATLTTDWLVGAALLLPTAEFRAVGGFDEAFYMNGEEVDLQRRLRDRGIPAIYVGEVSLVHVGGGSTDPERSRRWAMEGRWRYEAKWGHAARARTALTGVSLLNFVWNLGRSATGKPPSAPQTLRQEIDLIWRAR